MKKKALRVILLLVCMIVAQALHPVWTVQAANDTSYSYSSGGYTNIVTITHCYETGTSTTIPDQYEHKNSYGYWIDANINKLGPYVFNKCLSLKTVTVKCDYEMDIDMDAFNDCSTLEEINTTYSSWYESRDGILYNKGKTALIRCPEGKTGTVSVSYFVEELCDQAFYQCEKITGIEMRYGEMTRIGHRAFKGCKSIQGISMPDTVEEIGAGAFADCENLKSIIIPESVTCMWGGVFENCASLRDIFFECSREDLAVMEYRYGDRENQAYAFGEYGDAVESLRQKLDIAPNVRLHFDFDPYNYSDAKLNDGSLEIVSCRIRTKDEIVIPSWINDKPITSIGNGVFNYLINAIGVTIPDSVTNISQNAFDENHSIRYINIPESVTEIGQDAFHSCSRLEDIYYAGSESQWAKIAPSGSIDANIYYNSYPYDYSYIELEDGTVEISKYVGEDTDITIPSWLDGKRVSSIGKEAFYGSRVSSIGIPKSVVNVEQNAFKDCTYLKSIYYTGSRRQYRQIAVAAGNDYFEKADVYYADNTIENLEKYTISFNAWGVADYPSQTVEEYSLATDPGSPTRPDYVFLGWYNGEEKWDFAHDKAAGNMTLDARWEDEEKVSLKKVFGQMEKVDKYGNVIIPLEKEFILNAMSTAAYNYKETTWECSNKSIVSISSTKADSITIQGLSEGVATVKAHVKSSYSVWQPDGLGGGYMDYREDTTTTEFKRRVVSYLTDIRMDESEVALEKGESLPLNYTTNPSGNYARNLSEFKFSSSNTDVVRVSSDGILTAVGYGTATITAYTTNGNLLSAACTVKVAEPEKKTSIAVGTDGQLYCYENGVLNADKNGMVTDSDTGKQYWFEAGTAIKDKEKCDESGIWYWFGADGSMVKGWHKSGDGRTYYCELDSGARVYGEREIDGIPCYFDTVTGAGADCVWITLGGNEYWYENGIRQGMEGRGKEIYDPASDGWYWLDSVDQGKKAVSKDVYQESYSAYPDREDGTGKWVRYDAAGRMIKGWQKTEAGIYYFEEITGSMAKGTVSIDGTDYCFDEVTGILR